MSAPLLPPRKRKEAAPMNSRTASSASTIASPYGLDDMAQRAAEMVNSPGLQQLLADPAKLQSILATDPVLRGVFESSPELASLLHPDKLRAVLEFSKAPERLLGPDGITPEAAALFTGGDMSQQRQVSFVS